MQKFEQAAGARLERLALWVFHEKIGGSGPGLRVETEAHDAIAPQLGQELEHFGEFRVDVWFARDIQRSSCADR